VLRSRQLFIRLLAASQAALHGTTGAQITRGRAIINGCDNGLVEFGVDPPLRTGRGLGRGSFRRRVGRIVLSLVNPQGFITAVGPPRIESSRAWTPGTSAGSGRDIGLLPERG